MAEPEIRVATLADVPALAVLRRAWTEENAGSSIDDADFAETFADWFAREHDQRRTWLALVDGTPVGMLNLLVFDRMPQPGRGPSRWGYLANFFVLDGHRGSGVGTLLLQSCTAYADEAAFVRIVLSPSERSVPLYDRAGFAPATSLLVRPGP